VLLARQLLEIRSISNLMRCLRASVRVLVRDTGAATTAYGPYVTPLPASDFSGALSSGSGKVGGQAQRALQGCGSLVVLGGAGGAGSGAGLASLLAAARRAGVAHVLLLSAAAPGQQQVGVCALCGWLADRLVGRMGGGGCAHKRHHIVETLCEP
jgi:hypothetical protein